MVHYYLENVLMFVGFKLKLADGLIVQLLSVEIHVFFKKIKED